VTAALIAATSKQALWFASRGTGVVCLLLLTTSVVLGIMTSVRFEARGWPRFVIEGVHRNVSLLILVFVAIHIATTVIDGFAPIGFLDAVVPFRSPYRTAWLGLGAVALDLLLALAITSLLRVRLGLRIWRAVHWLAYVCWPVALVHGLGTGSDTREPWMIGISVAALVTVVSAAAWRISESTDLSTGRRVAAATAVVMVPVSIGAWAIHGPLQPGWGHSARGSASAATPPGSTEPPAAGSDPGEPELSGFSSAFDGTRTTDTSAGSGTATVSISGTVATGSPLALDIELAGRVVDRVMTITRGQVTMGPAADPTRWTGQVSRLEGGRLEASLSDVGNNQLVVSADLGIDSKSGPTTGTVSARPAANAPGSTVR